MFNRRFRLMLNSLKTATNWKFLGLLIILGFIVWNSLMVNEHVNDLSNSQSNLLKEVSDRLQVMEELKIKQKDYIMSFSKDLNEIRSYLLLPTRDYDFVKEEQQTPKPNLTESMLLYFDKLGEHEVFKKNKSDRELIVKGVEEDEKFQSLIKEDGIKYEIFDDINQINIKLYTDKDLFIANLQFPYNEKDLIIVQTAKSIVYPYENLVDVQSLIIDFLSTKIEYLKSYQAELIVKKQAFLLILEKKELLDLAREKKIRFDIDFTESDLYFVINIYNQSEEIIDQLYLDKVHLKFGFQEKGENLWYKDLTKFEVDLRDHLSSIIPFSKREQEIRTRIEEIIFLLEDEALQAVLAEQNLKINLTPVEEDKQLYFDIQNQQGRVISRLIIDRETGDINVSDADGANEHSINDLSTSAEKKTFDLPEVIPDYQSRADAIPDTFNLLITGKHGSLVDSIMVAHFNIKEKTISLISFPRDLFYGGRKINSVYAYYGMDELRRQISELTGLEIEKYILIDMYAFIEVINLINGVDVTLERALIDPSYKIFDDGKWSTLYYKAGTHHLNGKQALRLARSRHYSSDFARAERQQLIMQAVKDKSRTLGVGDADKLLGIIKIILEKTETNIGIREAMSYYFRYQGFEFKNRGVMSTGNILYSTYTGDLGLNPIEECTENEVGERECKVNRGAYILLPRDGKWNLIKWFVNQIIK